MKVLRVVLFACFVLSALGACISQQTEDAVKRNGLVFDAYYYMNLMGFSNVETALYHWYYNGYYVGLQGSAYCNVNEYKQIYPELAYMNNPEAFRHFVECGYYEGRVGLWSLYCGNNNGGCHPSTTCTNSYGNRQCGPCPAGHTGDGTGSCPVAEVDISNSIFLNYNVYNYDFYVTANADLAGYSIDAAARHWVLYGVDEGRQAVSTFNIVQYKQIYPDAAALSNRDAMTQFINTYSWDRVGLWQWWCGNGANGGCDAMVTCSNTFGASAPWCGMCPMGYSGSGTTPGSCRPTDYRVFSHTYYIAKYPELAGYDYTAAAQHWGTVGVDEGRQGIATFNVNEYKQIYPDIAGMSNFDAIGHYIRNGYDEQRAGTFSNWCGDGNNGGCDPLTTCTLSWGQKRCGWCPDGYRPGTGETPCLPW